MYALKPSEDVDKKVEEQKEDEILQPQEEVKIITAEPAVGKLKIFEHNSDLDGSGFLFVIGDMGNISRSKISPVVLIINFYNQEDELVETITEDFGSLLAGEHWKFSIKSKNKASVKYSIEIGIK